MHRALYVLLSHVPQCLWCLQGMIVHLGGPRSIMDTWWLHTMATRTSVTTYVLTRTQRLVQVRWQTKMVHYCSPWKVFVFHSRVIHMSPAESWPALYAPSNRRADSLVHKWALLNLGVLILEILVIILSKKRYFY